MVQDQMQGDNLDPDDDGGKDSIEYDIEELPKSRGSSSIKRSFTTESRRKSAVKAPERTSRASEYRKRLSLSAPRRSSFDDVVSDMVTAASMRHIDQKSSEQKPSDRKQSFSSKGGLSERRPSTAADLVFGTASSINKFAKRISATAQALAAPPARSSSLRRVMRPVVSSKNAMEVHTSDTFAKGLPVIGETLDKVAFNLSRKRPFQAGLLLTWAIGFIGGALSLCNLLDPDISDPMIYASVLMIPGEVFPILLFNKRIVMALLGNFETWFVAVNMAIPIVVLCMMVGYTRMVFVIASVPGLVSIPFMDAYPAFMRTKVIKTYFVLNMAYWLFWFWILHFGNFIELEDRELMVIGSQDHYAAEVCAGSILNLLCFACRNVWFSFRHPEWFAVLSTPLETVRLSVSEKPKKVRKKDKEPQLTERKLESNASLPSEAASEGSALFSDPFSSLASSSTSLDSSSSSPMGANRSPTRTSVGSLPPNAENMFRPLCKESENLKADGDGSANDIEVELGIIRAREAAIAAQQAELLKELMHLREKRMALEAKLPPQSWAQKNSPDGAMALRSETSETKDASLLPPPYLASLDSLNSESSAGPPRHGAPTCHGELSSDGNRSSLGVRVGAPRGANRNCLEPAPSQEPRSESPMPNCIEETEVLGSHRSPSSDAHQPPAVVPDGEHQDPSASTMYSLGLQGANASGPAMRTEP